MCVRDISTKESEVIDKIRQLPQMPKWRQQRSVFFYARLKVELEAFVEKTRCIDRQHRLCTLQKLVFVSFGANSLAQTFPQLLKVLGWMVLTAKLDAARISTT